MKVKTVDDGIKCSSKEVVQEHNEDILEKAGIPTRLRRRRQVLEGNKKIQRSMKANQKKTKAETSASVRDQK